MGHKFPEKPLPPWFKVLTPGIKEPVGFERYCCNFNLRREVVPSFVKAEIVLREATLHIHRENSTCS